jgi:hypothetical protein
MVNQLLAGASLLLLASATQAQPPGPLQRDEIVVVGAKLADLKADVARCEAGGCSVREDVIATVRYAEAEFREGNYHDARTALGKAVSRTKKNADSDPFAVAELHTARATVAWHFGDQREALRATGATTRLLDYHAPQSVNALMARMRLIQAQYQVDGPSVNIRELANLADRAEAANQPLIAMRADLGQAAMLYRANRRKEAKVLLDAILASDAPNSGPMKLAAEILDMRLALRDGDMKAVNALIARLSEDQKRIGPTLVWSPELPVPRGGDFAPSDPLLNQLQAWGSDLIGLRWVDIGYQIGPDGLVEDVEVLRGSPRSGWAKPLVEIIGRRRYTPAADPGDMAGRYRVERYTLTGDFVVPRGSMVRRRAMRPRFEQIDLTVAPPRQANAPTVPS